MKTVFTRTTVYKFSELPDKVKETALNYLWDINVDYDWWDCLYDNAKTIGCTIDGFDIDRGSYCKLICRDAPETARLIVENHGETCDTRKLADQYLIDRDKIIAEAEKDEDGEILDDYPIEELDAEFQRALGEEYLSILRKEYEYLTSEDAIIETIEANDYDFTEEGRIF